MDVIFLAPSLIVTLLVSFGVMLVKLVSRCWILIRFLSLWLGFEAKTLLNKIYFFIVILALLVFFNLWDHTLLKSWILMESEFPDLYIGRLL